MKCEGHLSDGRTDKREGLISDVDVEGSTLFTIEVMKN